LVLSFPRLFQTRYGRMLLSLQTFLIEIEFMNRAVKK